ncbi:MAG: TolC family protein [Candidatus Latescibacterota bacterium]
MRPHALTLGLMLCGLTATRLPGVPAPPYTLEELVEAAVAANAAVLEVGWKVREAQAQLAQARAAYLLPRLRLESEAGLVPDAEGDLFTPPADTTGWRTLGPFSRHELQFVQPLYTFGQLDSRRQAAIHGVSVGEADLAQARLDVAHRVRELYWGVLLARDLDGLAARLSKAIDEKLAEVDVDETLDVSDRYQLKLALVELGLQRGTVARKLELAWSALRWESGLPAGAPLELEAEGLEPVALRLAPLKEVTRRALAHRPDWRKLQAGLAARKEQADAARSAFFPSFYLAGGVRYAVAPGRTDQHNPFIKDEFNYLNAGAFLGMRQSLEWPMLRADAAKADAVYRQLRAKETSAVEGVELDVRRAYTDHQQAAAEMAAADESRKLARQWVQEAQDDYELDPASLDDLVAAFQAWATREKAYYEAVYAHNLALAELERKAGGAPLGEQP